MRHAPLRLDGIDVKLTHASSLEIHTFSGYILELFTSYGATDHWMKRKRPSIAGNSALYLPLRFIAGPTYLKHTAKI